MQAKFRKVQIEKARARLRALEQLPGYQSLDATYGVPNLQGLEAGFDAARHNTEQVGAAMQRMNVELANFLDAEDVAAEAFYRAVMIATSQAVIQYGSDSHVLTTLGRKRRSEYKRPMRKAGAGSS